MEAFLVSAGIAALADMGARTQLLALVLAARFRDPWPVVGGLFVATLANHALAGAIGTWVTNVLGAHLTTLVLGGSFVAMAVWMLIPDKLDEAGAPASGESSAFATAVVAFFLAELGGRAQVATVMLAARFQDWSSVVAGTTLGVLLASVPAVWFRERLVRAPLRLVQLVSAAIFFVLGAALLLGVD